MDDKDIYFRDQLRSARATALRDAEAFGDLLFCFERLGSTLSPEELKGRGLRKYHSCLVARAERSPLADIIPREFPQFHTNFSTLLTLVRHARNDALHQGAVARHLTRHAVEVALVLEDSLMIEEEAGLSAYMVRHPVCAFTWQPLSFLRQEMLTESFSYLPVRLDRGQGIKWHLVSDHALSSFLRGSDRKKRLGITLEAALGFPEFALYEASCCSSSTSIADALAKMTHGRPVLVCGDDESDLLGMATPFDLL